MASRKRKRDGVSQPSREGNGLWLEPEDLGTRVYARLNLIWLTGDHSGSYPWNLVRGLRVLPERGCKGLL